ncbi:hypothetical protein DYB36_001113, partial [Aphanomyces astaci]
YELSRLLNTGLDRESLSILISLVEKGVNPEALAAAVKEIRRSSNGAPSVSLHDIYTAYATATTKQLPLGDWQIHERPTVSLLSSRTNTTATSIPPLFVHSMSMFDRKMHDCQRS